MAVASRKRWRVVALGLALAVAGVVAGASGLVVWRRARVPWRTLHLPPKTRVRFFVGDRAVVTGRDAVSTYARRIDAFEEVWSLDDDKLLHNERRDPNTSWDRASGFRLRRGPDEGSLELEDPVTESRRRLLDPGIAPGGMPVAVSPGLDLVAFVSSAGVEVRSALGTRPRPSRVLPTRECRELRFSAGGEALAVCERGDANEYGAATWHFVVWSLGSPGSPRVFEDELLEFTARGDVVTATPVPRGAKVTSSIEVTLHRASGESRVVAEVKVPFALSLWCQRLATLEPDGRSVVVTELESGALVRRVRVGPNVLDLQLSPEGDKLAVAFEDGLIEVWELPPS